MTSDQLHRLLLDNLNTAVLLVDQSLLIDYINPAAEALLQAGSARLRGAEASELFDDDETARQTLREALEFGRALTLRHEFLSGLGVESSQVDYTVTPISIGSDQWVLMEMQPVDRI
ncbi:MAG: PAS domain-containing protein, partial [Porticoccaceae bacterium]|nr:PAS domain-containing protein [Porticoccaceae bacterium]